jgi:hypothetical protein
MYQMCMPWPEHLHMCAMPPLALGTRVRNALWQHPTLGTMLLALHTGEDAWQEAEYPCAVLENAMLDLARRTVRRDRA